MPFGIDILVTFIAIPELFILNTFNILSLRRWSKEKSFYYNKNGGRVKSLNKAIEMVEGKYCAILDSMICYMTRS